jgi:hypothetical protein
MLESDYRFLASLETTHPARASFLRTSIENSDVVGQQARGAYEGLDALDPERDTLGDALRAIHLGIPKAMHPLIRAELFPLEAEKEN